MADKNTLTGPLAVAELIGSKPGGKKYAGMEGCINEGAEVLDEDGEESILDLGLIRAGTIADTRRAEDAERKATAHLLLWLFLSLMIEAFCGSYEDTIGGAATQ